MFIFVPVPSFKASYNLKKKIFLRWLKLNISGSFSVTMIWLKRGKTFFSDSDSELSTNTEALVEDETDENLILWSHISLALRAGCQFHRDVTFNKNLRVSFFICSKQETRTLTWLMTINIRTKNKSTFSLKKSCGAVRCWNGFPASLRRQALFIYLSIYLLYFNIMTWIVLFSFSHLS